MIGIYAQSISNIPCLIIVDSEKEDLPLPTVSYYHGFTSGKENNLTFAYLLAEKGYRVILPDSLYHGERSKKLSKTELNLAFWDIVQQTLNEVRLVRNYLNEQGLILDHRFGIAGTSMGGIVTSAAIKQYSWIKVAAVLMGTPQATTYAKKLIDEYESKNPAIIKEEEKNRVIHNLQAIDLSRHTDALAERPLMFWHGIDDQVVPFQHVESFYEQVKDDYQNPDHIQLIKEANRGHYVSRYAILETVKWFVQYL